MSERIVFDTLCPIGARLQRTIDQDIGEGRRLAQILMDAEDTYVAHIDRYKSEVAKDRMELYRHAGHCDDGCVRTPGQFAAARATSWRRAPSHDKPELPPAADLAALIRNGATLRELADKYDRHPSTLGQHLTKAGWSTKTGQTLTATPAPLRQLARKLDDEQPWRIDAICAQTDPESFFPEKGGSTRDAKSVCASCTVSAECLDYAIEHDERFGIWGGLSERERRKVKAALTNTGSDHEPATPPRQGISMTTTAITEEKRLATLKHLATDKGLDVVATIVALPRETVLDIGSHHGYPDRDKLAWAADIIEKKLHDAASDLPAARPLPKTATPAPAAPAARPAAAPAPAPEPLTKPDEIRVLLNTAKGHPSKRIQAAADKVFDQLERVHTLLREDEEKHAAARRAAAEKAAARAEVERLEAQLAAAKAKLRGKPTPTPTSSKATDTPADGEHTCDHDDCDRAFATVQALRLHERRAHEGFNPNAVKAAS